MEDNKKNNHDDKDFSDKNEITFSEIFRIFLKRKWLFIGFFIVILVAGLAVTFITSPMYKTASTLKFSNVFYDENLYRYFPAEAEEMAIYAPGMKSTELENSNLDKYASRMRTDEIISQVAEKIGNNASVEDINRTITVIQDKGKRVFQVEVAHEDPQTAYNINKSLFDVFSADLNSEESLNILLDKIDLKVDEIKEEIASLDSGNSDNNEIDISSRSVILNNLEEMKYNLENNKDILTKKVEITKEPSIPESPYNLDYKKNIFIVIFAALMVGLIAVYLPEIFIRNRKKI